MSSKKEEEIIHVTKEENTTQITANDVVGCLKANCLDNDYKILRKTNTKTMKNWIIYRPKKIEIFHAFVMLCLHCKSVAETLCLMEIMNLFKWLKLLTADCLDNVQILREKPPGKRQGNWMKKIK